VAVPDPGSVAALLLALAHLPTHPQRESSFVGHVCRLLLERRRPAGEEVQRLLRLRTGLSRVRQDGETSVGSELAQLLWAITAMNAWNRIAIATRMESPYQRPLMQAASS
jgi:hypothetical protein